MPNSTHLAITRNFQYSCRVPSLKLCILPPVLCLQSLHSARHQRPPQSAHERRAERIEDSCKRQYRLSQEHCKHNHSPSANKLRADELLVQHQHRFSHEGQELNHDSPALLTTLIHTNSRKTAATTSPGSPPTKGKLLQGHDILRGRSPYLKMQHSVNVSGFASSSISTSVVSDPNASNLPYVDQVNVGSASELDPNSYFTP